MSLIPDISDRDRETQAGAAKFEMPPSLSNPDSRQVVIAYARLAYEMIRRCPDGELLSSGLSKLHEARGFHMRAVSAARNRGGVWT